MPSAPNSNCTVRAPSSARLALFIAHGVLSGAPGDFNMEGNTLSLALGVVINNYSSPVALYYSLLISLPGMLENDSSVLARETRDS